MKWLARRLIAGWALTPTGKHRLVTAHTKPVIGGRRPPAEKVSSAWGNSGATKTRLQERRLLANKWICIKCPRTIPVKPMCEGENRRPEGGPKCAELLS